MIRFTLALGLAALFHASDGQAAIQFMALGDSITAGVGSSDTQYRWDGSGWANRGGTGYRGPLNALLQQDVSASGWNFIGTRDNPSTDALDQPQPIPTTYANNWNRHFGRPGETASTLRDNVLAYDGDTHGRPDVILLHIGSNSSGSDMTTNPSNYGSATNADAQLYRLLDTLRIDGDFNTAGTILVGRIIPKANSTGLANIIDYNYSTTQGISGAISKLPSDFASRIILVDFFKINVTSSMLSFLAQQTGELVNDLQSWIDPGNTGYVDWLGGLNEATHQITGSITRNPYLYTDIVGYNGANYIYGTSDGTHPSDLGYAIMGWAWHQGLIVAAGVIPEPISFAFLAGGALLLIARRRCAA